MFDPFATPRRAGLMSESDESGSHTYYKFELGENKHYEEEHNVIENMNKITFQTYFVFDRYTSES